MINIRKEKAEDHKEVYQLVKDAFEHAEHRDGTEQDLVEKLRKGEAFIPELSLVATDTNNADKIVGHILLTKLALGKEAALAIAPLSVHPDYQKQGIGTMLLKEGHQAAKDLGYAWTVLLGSENYYPRVGYQPASVYGIKPPFEAPDENFMALCLQGEPCMVNQTAQFAKEFSQV